MWECIIKGLLKKLYSLLNDYITKCEVQEEPFEGNYGHKIIFQIAIFNQLAWKGDLALLRRDQ
jgi:hypothetical protein